MKRLAFLILLAAAPAHAIDKDRLAQHLRENLSLDKRTEIVVQGDPVPAGFANLDKVVVMVGGAPYDVLLTTDNQHYIWGLVADLSKSPDAVRAAKISLKDVHAVGAANAPVTIVEYSDLECSYCKKAHDILTAELYKAYKPSQVRWVYKHFPLNSHPWAMKAAAVAECAGEQKPDAFWKVADFYFANQEKLKEEDVLAKGEAEAAKHGVKADALKACVESPKTQERILADKQEGQSVGVSSTPTLFINGRMRRGFRDFEDIRAVVDEKLNEKK